MSEVTGKFSRQHQRIGYSALVIVEVAEDTEISSGGVVFAEGWSGYAENGWVGDGDPYWQKAAVLGVNHAYHIAGQRSRCVTVDRIHGDYTVTNPTVVGAATIDAVWQSTG